MRIHPYLLLAGIVLVGAILRVYHFDFQPVACDELYTLMIAQRTYLDGILYVMTNDTNPPLFYSFTHFFYPLIRIPSVLFGILTIPAIYFLGKEIRDESIGLLCAGIVAVLYPLIYYSQFARAYAMVTFLMILFFIQFIRLQNRASSNYYLLGIVAALAVWTHLYAIFPILATLLVIFVETKKNAVKSFVPVLLTLIAFIPLFIATRETRLEQHGNFPGFSAMELISMIPIEFFNIGLFVLLPLIVIGIYNTKDNNLSLKLLAIVCLSFIAGISVSLFTQVFPRYFLPLLPILIVFASIGLSSLLDKLKPWAKPIVVTGFFVLLTLTQVNALWAHYTIPWLSC